MMAIYLSLRLITEGKTPDIAVARQFHIEPYTIVVDDRGYTDYLLFGRWTSNNVYFVTRMKDNAVYKVIKKNRVPCHCYIRKDEIICQYLQGPLADWNLFQGSQAKPED